jgi:UDP-glucose 4-epimerase
MNGKRCLITGGIGLIGSNIADILVQEGASEVVLFDNFTRGRLSNTDWARKHGTVRIIEGDIRDGQAVREAMEGIDTVFHQAAIRITHCAEDPRLAHDVLATGTLNVIEAACDAGVRKVVAASSASIYGLATQFPTTEDHHPYDNNTIYGAAKVYLEGLLRSYHAMRGLDYVALRYFNVYGPRMDIYGAYTEVLIRWMDRLIAGQPPLILGDGLQTMDFIYVEDVARANVLAAKSPATDEVFNVASETETSLRDLAAALQKVMGTNFEPEFGPARKVNPVPRRLASTAKARKMIGFEASVSLEEGLERLVAWWREQRAAGTAETP